MSALTFSRPIQNLDGLWDFTFLGPIDLTALTPSIIARTSYSEKAPIPSAFDALPAHVGKRGAALYRRTFHLPAGQAAQLQFGAVSIWCRILVDGVLLHENACGFAPFRVLVPPSEIETRELVVLVDNRFDLDRAPMHEEYFDFYQYGGILRSIELHQLPAGQPFLDHVLISPLAKYRQGEIEVQVLFGGSFTAQVTLRLTFDDAALSHTLTLDVSEDTTRFTVSVPQPRIWSPATPELHTVRVTLLDASTLTPIDSQVLRFGLRQVESREGKLWLNGEPLVLRGFNRHEWHPNFGPATPPLLMAGDLQLMRAMGCNFVRGSHYHQDQRFLSLCDELGFLVWEENLGWQQREHALSDPQFRRDHRIALESMLRHSFNHPSIIIWGFLNEALSDKECARPIFTESVELIRRIDPRRLVSYATMFAATDLYYDLVDLISLNIYPGWYNCAEDAEPLKLIRPFIADCIAKIDARGNSAKPVLISEIGAEAIYGWHDPHQDFFSEEFQAAYLAEACSAVLSHPRCCGIALWHFSDARTYGGGRALGRPRTFNNKGAFDEYRRPKLAVSAIRTEFAKSR